MIAPQLLSPADYLDPAIFTAERETIFDRFWHLAGLARDVPETDDWRLVTIAGTEVILQNIGNGEIRAFTNSCPHRFSAIRTEPKGRGALRCPYHMWAFDGEGKAAAVPLRGDVALEECQAKNLHLERWATALCGEFLFVARAPEQSLPEFFGPMADTLVMLSDAISEEAGGFEQDIAANWKIVMQNTVEFDHAFSVHPETFTPLMIRGRAPEPLPCVPPHIAYLMPMKIPDANKPGIRRIEKIYKHSTLPPHEGYAHWLLFPATTLGTTFNHQIGLITYQPVAADRTHARIRNFIPKLNDLSAGDRAILNHLTPTHIAFTRQLLEEDKRICETVQRGISNASPTRRGCLMPGDKLVGQWQGYYLDSMDRTMHVSIDASTLGKKRTA
jgi:phenylpropionate dioxygenase-like ring-hydroxylating dioxygenase large terminal subunit